MFAFISSKLSYAKKKKGHDVTSAQHRGLCVCSGHCCVSCCENYKIVFSLDRQRCSFSFLVCVFSSEPFTCRAQVRARKNARVSRVIYPSRPSPSSLSAHPSSHFPYFFLLPPLLHHLAFSLLACQSSLPDFPLPP